MRAARHCTGSSYGRSLPRQPPCNWLNGRAGAGIRQERCHTTSWSLEYTAPSDSPFPTPVASPGNMIHVPLVPPIRESLLVLLVLVLVMLLLRDELTGS
jgi:hypothetical protein